MQVIDTVTAIGRLKAFAKRYRKFLKEKGRKGYTFSLPQRYGGDQGGGVKLKFEEYQELVAIMRDGKKGGLFIFEPVSMGMNDFSLCIYRRPLSLRERPIPLFTLGGSSLPDEKRKMMKQNDNHPAYILDDSFREYSPFSHSEANKKLLAKHKMESPCHLEHYGY